MIFAKDWAYKLMTGVSELQWFQKAIHILHSELSG